MITEPESVIAAALALPLDYRVQLFEQLRSNLGLPPGKDEASEIEREWDEEIERRLAEYRAGTAPTVSGDEVLRFLADEVRKSQ